MEEITFLILTISIELPVALVFLRKENWQQVVLVVFGVNMISHPIVWQLIFSQHLNWFLAEAGVIVFESLIFGLLFLNRRRLAVATAIFMNLLTAAIGYWMS